jgi:hypothetical protein
VTACFRVSTLLTLLLTIAGCGGGAGDRPEVAPVKGTVMYKGQPVAGANVNFYNEGAPRAGYAITNESGEFELTTFEPKDGAVLGDHVVTVSKADQVAANTQNTSSGPPSAEDLTKQYVDTKEAAKDSNTLPAKYASQETTPLKFTVTAGEGSNNFLIELVD